MAAALPLLAAAAAASAPSRLLQGRYVAVALGSSSCDVTDAKYGARGDGKTNDTAAVQAALDDCGRGGGTVVLPAPGRFLVSAIAITGSSTELHIAAGATLLVSNDMAQWPKGKDVITARGVTDIAISGGGTVDGQGEVWWKAREKDEGVFRPRLVSFSSVTRALLTDTLYLNSPNHVLELGADHCEVARVKVLAPPSTGSVPVRSHNTDAVDVHGAPFYVHSVNFTTGDDNVAIHANHTLVEDSYFGTGHGASIGSLCNSWLWNITVRNITFRGTTAGCRIKSHPKCGGHVWNVLYEDLDMSRVGTPIQINQFYDGTDNSNYLFENITFRNIRSSDSWGSPAVNFDCATGYDGKANCHNMVLDSVHFDHPKGGMVCKGVWGTEKDLKGISSCLPAPPK